MLDQLIIGDKASLDDFDASLATRSIGVPKMKTIKETVPFSNVTYDFTRINGEPYYEERKLEYGFEIVAEDPEELEDKKAAFAEWVMSVFEADIHDPHIFGFHFRGTYEDLKFKDDDSLEKTTASVTFTAYPYKIANVPKVYETDVSGATSKTLQIINNSSHKITPSILTEGSVRLEIGTAIYDIVSSAAVSFKDGKVIIPPGVMRVNVSPITNAGSVRISFYEEVL